MLRKIATVAGAAALLLGAAAPALATYRHYRMPDYDITNKAIITTSLTVKADTGDNTQKVYGAGNNVMGTGEAYATGTVATFANLWDGCDCLRGDLVNKARVNTNATVEAETGDNTQKVRGGMVRPIRLEGRGHHNHHAPVAMNELWTGPATAMGDVFTLVNASWMPE